MKKAAALAVAAIAVAIPVTAKSALVIGWADEFWLGTVTVYGSTPCADAPGQLFTFQSSLVNAEPTFEIIGQQTLAGKTNAKAKVMFRFNVKNCSNGDYYTQSATVTRFYWTPGTVPGSGSTCANGTALGVAVQTFDSQSAGASGQRIQNRLLPVFDFSAQSGTGVYGYRDNLSVIGGTDENACYRISWF